MFPFLRVLAPAGSCCGLCCCHHRKAWGLGLQKIGRRKNMENSTHTLSECLEFPDNQPELKGLPWSSLYMHPRLHCIQASEYQRNKSDKLTSSSLVLEVVFPFSLLLFTFQSSCRCPMHSVQVLQLHSVEGQNGVCSLNPYPEPPYQRLK